MEVWVFGHGVLDLGLGFGVVELVGAGVENGVLVAGDRAAVGVVARRIKGATEQFVNEALAALAGVELFETTDENHDIAAIGQRFFDQCPTSATGRVVVDANKAKAVALSERPSRE